MNGRETILSRIKDAVKNSSGPFSTDENNELKIKNGFASITPKDNTGLWTQFKNELEIISGEFHFVKNIDNATEIISKFLIESKFERIGISKEKICSHAAEIIHKRFSNIKIISPDKLSYQERKKEYSETETAVVHPAYAVADIGSLVFPYVQTGTSYPHFLCDNIFAIINKNQIVANQFELFEKIDLEEAKNMVFVTGPSRTADIEKVLVLGAHGPRKLVVIVCSEEFQ